MNLRKVIVATFLVFILAFAVGATSQGKGQKSGKKISSKQLPTVTDVSDGSDDPNLSKKPEVSKAPTVSKKPDVSKKSTVSKNPSVSKKSTLKKSTVSKKSIPTLPNVSGGGVGTHQSCVKSCNAEHKNDAEICRGRTGTDRASCQQSINEQHRLCIQSCPK